MNCRNYEKETGEHSPSPPGGVDSYRPREGGTFYGVLTRTQVTSGENLP